MKGVKLEVGKTYLDRKNRKVTITRNDAHPTYPFNGDNNTSYTEYGNVYFSNTKSDADLISEYIEESIFRVKGTKLPNIGKNVQYKTVGGCWCNWGADNETEYYSFGIGLEDGTIYADEKGYTSENYLVFKESDLIKLAEEQGMEWRVKPEFVLPERWKVLRTSENTDVLSKWANEVSNTTEHCGYGNKDHPNYIHSENIDTGNTPRSGNNKDFTEITLDQFKQYVLKQKTETMEKEIIGYKFKNELGVAIKSAALAIIQASQFVDKTYGGKVDVQKPENIEKYRKAKVLDLWFEPVYRETEQIINIGFDVIIKNKRAFVGSDDITEFVIDMIYTYNQIKSFGGFTVDIKDITFKRTGCKSVKTKLSDWKKIYDLITEPKTQNNTGSMYNAC